MKKALLYLLLALGISVAVLLVGGAIMGFAAGFIDGFNESNPGTTSPSSLMTYSGLIMIVGVCAILHWVFIRWRFAEYSKGLVPKEKRWQVLGWLLLAMGGLALIYWVIYNPLAEPDGTMLTESDDTIRATYLWMKSHPIYTLLWSTLIEATADLVIFGAVLREILEWRHRPQVIIPIFAAIMGLLNLIMGKPLLIIPSMLVAIVEAWTYECTRSIIPIIIGDIFYWIVSLILIGTPLSPWFLLVAVVIILPSVIMLMKTMDPYKPID